MLKNDYFLKCIKKELYKKKNWVISILALVSSTKDRVDNFIIYSKDGKYCYFDSDLNEEVIITDSDSTKPLFTVKSKIKVKALEILNFKEDTETTVGRVIVNMVALVLPFGDKFAFKNEEFNVGLIEKEIAKRLTTDVKYQTEDSKIHKDPIYVEELLKFIDAVFSLEGYCQLAVPSASEKSLTTDPNIRKVRDALLEKFKDQLDDPVIVANIEAELVQMDKDWIKGDISEGFFIKGKHFEEVRKQMHVIYGPQKAFGTKQEVIGKSLDEGWDIDKLPGMINSLREASYARGKGTASGGYATKIVNRMFQNIFITEKDCGSKLGWKDLVTEDNKKDFIGFYYLTNNKPILITEDVIGKLVGKVILRRSPQFCKTENNKLCTTCMGEMNSENKQAISSYVSDITSTLMLKEMKKMHVGNVSTTTYKFKEAIT